MCNSSALFNLSICFAVVGCASPGSYKASKAPPPANVTIAVKQFSSEGYSKMSTQDRGLRDFEHVFLSGKLADRLAITPGCSGAYFSTGDTVATDLTVRGNVDKSNGKDLVLDITAVRVDGRKILNKSYSVSHLDGNQQKINTSFTKLFDQISADVVAAGRKTTINLQEARTMAYAQNAKVVLNPENLNNADLAAKIERNDILGPLTKAMVPRARIAEKPYLEWRSLSTPLVIEKEAAAAQKEAADVQAAMGFVAGLASVASSYGYAQQGNTLGVQLANQNLMTSTQLVAEAEAKSTVASNKVKAIEGTLSAFKNTFAVGATRQFTVKIYDKLIHLNGTQSDQLQEFKKVVKEKLNVTVITKESN